MRGVRYGKTGSCGGAGVVARARDGVCGGMREQNRGFCRKKGGVRKEVKKGKIKKEVCGGEVELVGGD